MHDHGAHWDPALASAFQTLQQCRVVGKLSGIDFAGGDAAQHLVGVGELFALAVLAAGQLDAGPDPVLFAVLDRPFGALALLRQGASTQALCARLDGRPLVDACLRGPIATVVIGGLVTSTTLTLLVLPALYRWFERDEREVEL